MKSEVTHTLTMFFGALMCAAACSAAEEQSGSSGARISRLMREPRLSRGNTNVLRLQGVDEASWIWHPEATSDREPTFLKFRCEFESAAADGPLELDVSADERYVLKLDGGFVSRGPNRADVENWQYQSYRIDLAPGAHVLEATAWRVGDDAPLAQLSWKGGFVLRAYGAYDSRLTTGKGAWRVGRLAGISPCGQDGGGWGNGSQWTVVGAGIEDGEPAEWTSPAVVRGPAGEPGPLVYAIRTPGWMLFPSQLPDQTERRTVPGRVVAVSRSALWREKHVYTDDETRETIDLAKPFTVPARSRMQFAWDLGDYYCAYPEVVLSGGKGARLGFGWSECAHRRADGLKGQEDGSRNLIAGRYIDAYGDTFVSDGRERARFTVPWFRCGKWVRIDVETDDEPLTVESLALFESRYPLEMESDFSSPQDASFAAIRRLCERAQQMCTHEMLFDCPFYEEQMYPGDSRVQLNVITALTRDDAMVKRVIELYDLATRDDGQCPFNWPTRGTQEGAGYTLCYLLMFGDYVMNHADREWLRHRIPGMRKSMAGLEVYENADGLLQDLPGWVFMDWALGWPVGNPYGARVGEGVSCEVNLMWNLVMRSAALTERALGNELQARYWEEKSERLKVKIVERFWNEKRGILASTLDADHFSEHAQSLALLGEVLPDDKRESAWRHLLADEDLDRCSFYFSFYLIETYFKFGRGDLFLKKLDDWREYVRKGLCTTPEVPDVGENQSKEARSDCHAWAAHPVWFMQTGLAGIRSAAPFFSRVRVAPCPGGLKEIKARHPHPDGWVDVDLSFDGEKVSGTVETPVPGEFEYGGRKVALKSGRNIL